MRSQLNRLFGQLHAMQNHHAEALRSFAEDAYFCAMAYGPEDLRCSPCYFNLGKVFLAQGERVNALACNAKVLAIWLCTLCNVVLGELPSTCKIESPAAEVTLNKAQLREARVGGAATALPLRRAASRRPWRPALRCVGGPAPGDPPLKEPAPPGPLFPGPPPLNNAGRGDARADRAAAAAGAREHAPERRGRGLRDRPRDAPGGVRADLGAVERSLADACAVGLFARSFPRRSDASRAVAAAPIPARAPHRDNATAKRTLEHAVDLYSAVLSTHMEALATKAYKKLLDAESEAAEKAAREAEEEARAAKMVGLEGVRESELLLGVGPGGG